MSKALALREAKTEYANHISWLCVDCGLYIEPFGDGTYPKENRCWSCDFDHTHPSGNFTMFNAADVGWYDHDDDADADDEDGEYGPGHPEFIT